MIPRIATDAVATRSDHAGAELVEDLERRFVAVQAKLALELDGRHAWCMARNQVCGPEPDRQRRAGPLHDRASRQRVIPLTVAAPQNVRPIGEAVGFAGFAAPSADKPIAPADGFKVSSARRIVRKQALELGQRTRKWQILARQDGSGHRVFTPALPIVGLGVNRISMVLTMILPRGSVYQNRGAHRTRPTLRSVEQ